MDEILKVDHLKASYGNETILKDISFGVRKGEIRMVLGSSVCVRAKSAWYSAVPVAVSRRF